MNALTKQEARASNAVVEGTVCLARYTARVLFDPGATHSFISFAFASKMNNESESMKFQLVVSTPVGVELVTNTYYRGCEVIGNVKTSADLAKLGDMEYDLILEIHWLSTYHALVDYHQKWTTFKLEGTTKFIFEGLRMNFIYH